MQSVGRTRGGEPSWGDGTSLAEGISELYAEHVDTMLGWFQARTYSGQTAADLCAETFAVALENAAKYDPTRGDAGAWLWGIARNLLRRYHRTEAVDARARARLAIQTPHASEDDLDLIDSQSDGERLHDMVEKALDELSPKVAAAVRKRVLEAKPYSVVAEECDASEATVRVRVSRGLSTLVDRASLSDLGEVNW